MSKIKLIKKNAVIEFWVDEKVTEFRRIDWLVFQDMVNKLSEVTFLSETIGFVHTLGDVSRLGNPEKLREVD